MRRRGQHVDRNEGFPNKTNLTFTKLNFGDHFTRRGKS